MVGHTLTRKAALPDHTSHAPQSPSLPSWGRFAESAAWKVACWCVQRSLPPWRRRRRAWRHRQQQCSRRGLVTWLTINYPPPRSVNSPPCPCARAGFLHKLGVQCRGNDQFLPICQLWRALPSPPRQSSSASRRVESRSGRFAGLLDFAYVGALV